MGLGTHIVSIGIFSDTLKLLHEVQKFVTQGCVAKIKCGKYLILKNRKNHIFFGSSLCRAKDGLCKALTLN